MITAGAGALDSMVAKASAKAGLAGLEFYAGIPGTIGGALTMNAGCWKSARSSASAGMNSSSAVPPTRNQVKGARGSSRNSKVWMPPCR